MSHYCNQEATSALTSITQILHTQGSGSKTASQHHSNKTRLLPRTSDSGPDKAKRPAGAVWPVEEGGPGEAGEAAQASGGGAPGAGGAGAPGQSQAHGGGEQPAQEAQPGVAVSEEAAGGSAERRGRGRGGRRGFGHDADDTAAGEKNTGEAPHRVQLKGRSTIKYFYYFSRLSGFKQDRASHINDK